MQYFTLVLFSLLQISSIAFSEETTTISDIASETEAPNITEINEATKLLKMLEEAKALSEKNETTTTTTVAPSTTIKTTTKTPTTVAEKAPRSAPQIKRQIPADTDILNSVNYNESEKIDIKDLTDDLDTWEAPYYIQKHYPYYLAGYDEDARPIWSAELGKFDLRYIVEQGGELQAAFEKYAQQAARRVLVSIYNRSTEERPVTEALFLVDFDGLQLRQVSYVPSLTFLIKLALSYRDLIVNHLGATVIVNANFLAENVIRVFKPMFGPAMAKVEIYGTNKQKWIPVVRRVFGPEQLPEWYGGNNKNYAPVAVFG